MNVNPVTITGGTVTTVTQRTPPPTLPKRIFMATAFLRADRRPCVGLRIGDWVEVAFADGAVAFARDILAAAAQAKQLEHALRDRELVAKLLDGPTRDAYQAGWQSYGRVLAERGQQ